MIIGVPREIKNHEYRVGVTPAGVSYLVSKGHSLVVERGAGEKIGFSDTMYVEAGARLVDSPAAVYECPMIVKVKEPQASEFPLMHEGQLLFTYLHLAPDPEQTRNLLERKIIGIAYETVTDSKGQLPLLVPMSEVAGRIAIQAGATALQMAHGGNGTLLGGVPGVEPASVVIIGAGVVGTQAAKMAIGLGADVTVLDISLERLRFLDDVFGPALRTRYADPATTAALVKQADLLIGAVLIAGKQAPKLVSRDLVSNMKAGSVIVDVAIDQGGCIETSRPTTHSEPTYVVDDVVHYCVANMPGACARTSTLALTNATLPYVEELASQGWLEAIRANEGLRAGLNLYRGHVTNASVAADLGYTCLDIDQILSGVVAAA